MAEARMMRGAMRGRGVRTLLLSVLVALAMVVGFGRTHAVAGAAGVPVVMGHQAGLMAMDGACARQGGCAHHRHVLGGCASCSMTCCAAVLPSAVVMRVAQPGRMVAYVAVRVGGRRVVAAPMLEPPRPNAR